MKHYYVSIISIIIGTSPCYAESTKIKHKLITHTAATQNFTDANDVITRSLTLNEYVKLIINQDELIRSQQLEVDIAREGIKGAEAIFEPAFFASAGYENKYTTNTAIEAKQRQGTVANAPTSRDSDEFRSKEYQYKTGLLWKSPLGTDLELSYNLDDTWNSLQQDVYGGNWNRNDKSELKSYLGVKLAQPLLREAGLDYTRSEIDIA